MDHFDSKLNKHRCGRSFKEEIQNLTAVDEQQFFETLREAIKDSQRRYYRNLVYIEKRNNPEEIAIKILKLYLQLNPNALIAYAFHPWAEGAKERLKKFREEISDNLIDIDYSSSDKYLGNTFDVVVLDFTNNFEPNYVGRLVDLVRGGGLAIIYTDSLLENKKFRNSLIYNGKILDVYEKRFLRKLEEYEGIFIVKENSFTVKPFKGEVKKKSEPLIPVKPLMPEEIHKLCLSSDQNRVLESFFNLRVGKRKVLVITSARGRGKSAVTGLGIAGLISLLKEKKRKYKVVITAPSMSGISQIIEFLKRGLDVLNIQYKEKKGKNATFPTEIEGENFRVLYEIPDAVLETEGDLLVMDEAAAIGVGYIDSALKIWDKVVLVTTVHGYEGSGKAFLRYLKRILSLRKAIVYWQEMVTPLRYAEGDPIEKWLYDTLLLDAEPEEPRRIPEKLVFETIDKEELFSNEKRLRQVYGILVTAHYRNNPNDLMIMGDGIHHTIKTLSTIDGKDIGVVQIAEEGGLPESLIESALMGVTFDGNLIPDRLIKHTRLKEFGRMRGWRIVRIAIMQELQNKGFGSELLKMIVEDAERQGIDWVGSAFMSDIRVLNFWIKNGFYPVHVSPRRNEKLGDYPVVVMKPISEVAKRALKIATYILKDKLLNTIHDVYFGMDPEIVRILLNGAKVHKEVRINRIYIDKVVAFLQGVSPYESSADGIHMLTLKYFWDAKRDWSLSPQEETLLIAKVLQGRPWRFTSSTLRANRTEVSEMLYEIISQLLYKYYGITPDVKTGVELKDIDDEFRTSEI